MSRENSFNLKAKTRYIRRMLHHRWQGQPRVCPYCGPSSMVALVRRKKWIVEILQCQTCHLWFRWPADSPWEHDKYYQQEFAGDSPQVVLPDDLQLRSLANENFSSSPLDINDKVKVLRSLRPDGRVLDFGCSWGYGTFQLVQQGFDAVGFEISKPRADYGSEKMGLKIIDTIEALDSLPGESFDVVFSNHVVEHLPNIAAVFPLLARLLRKNGFVFHVLPNFMGAKARSGYWLKWIGEDHPVAPAMPFFDFAIPRSGLSQPVFASSPFDVGVAQGLQNGRGMGLSTEGDELLVFARRD